MLRVECEDTIGVYDEKNEPIVNIDMDSDMSDIFESIEVLVEYFNEKMEER